MTLFEGNVPQTRQSESEKPREKEREKEKRENKERKKKEREWASVSFLSSDLPVL